MQEMDAQFLDYVVKALVDNPASVKITRTVDEMGVLLTLDVNAADMGKVIGRMGNTAKAIRTLLRVVGMKNNSRVNLKISEPEGGLRPEMRAVSDKIPEGGKATKSVDEAMADLNL
ncbi:MAG: KH domain-containing protein [Candidatus Paceibacterota bacterium]